MTLVCAPPSEGPGVGERRGLSGVQPARGRGDVPPGGPDRRGEGGGSSVLLRISNPDWGVTAALDVRKLMEDYGVASLREPGARTVLAGAAQDVRMFVRGWLGVTNRAAYPLPRWVVYVNAPPTPPVGVLGSEAEHPASPEPTLNVV
jgi:hypothetical protein